ncbi:MAG: CoA ester lyase [Pseudomonadota bacterium]
MFVPRRSVLYLPGVNERAQAKAAALDCDALIFDLEDAVAPDAKAAARERVRQSLLEHDYGHRELLLRINALSTPWGGDDVRAGARLPVAGYVLPKVESALEVRAAAEALAAAGAGEFALWLMIESPASVLALEELCAAHPAVRVLVMGTSDLVQDLRASHTPGREGLLYALSKAVTCARAFGLEALDGVHLDFRNAETFASTCRQGRALGFDGRTLIHPDQIAPANEIYGIADADVERARRVLAAWDAAVAAGVGVVELDGQLVENLHADEARRLLDVAAALTRRA